MADHAEMQGVIDRVRALVVTGELAAATRKCRQYLAFHPDALSVRRELAQVAHAVHDLPTALSESEAVLRTYATDQTALWVRASARTGLCQSSLAAAELAEVLQQHSNDPRVLRAAWHYARVTRRLRSEALLAECLLRHAPPDAAILQQRRRAALAQLAPAPPCPASGVPLAPDAQPKVDAVFTWVDGRDPAWLSRFEAHTGIDPRRSIDRAVNRRRYDSHGEIQFSLRCLDRFVPWLRTVWVLTDGQRFDTRPLPAGIRDKICFVDHREVLPTEVLPTFCSAVIESFLHRIPGLGDYFLYFNDDMMVGAPLDPADVLTADGRVRNAVHPRAEENDPGDLERRRLMDRDRLANSMAGRETATADLYRAVVGALPPYADLHQFRVLSRGICERTVELFQHAFRSCLYPHRVRAKSVPKIPDLWTWVGIDAGLSEVIEVTVGASAGYAAPEFSPEHAAQLLTMRPRGFCLNVFDDSIDLLDAFGAAYLDSGSRPQLPVDPLLEAARAAAQRGSAPQ